MSWGNYEQVVTAAVFVGAITVLGNSVVLTAIMRPRNRDRLRTASNILIAILAVTDLLVGIFFIPGTILAYYGLPKNLHGCIMVFLLTNCPMMLSVWGYLLITIERFVAIRLPYLYPRVFTKASLRKMIAALLAVSLVYCIIPFFWNQGWKEESICRFTQVMDPVYMHYVETVVFLLLPFLTISGIYSYILVVTIRQIHLLRRQQLPPPAQEHNAKFSWQHGVGMEIRAAWRCFLMIALFGAMQLIPRLVWTIRDINGISSSNWNPMAYVFLLVLNSTINPILYTYTTKDLKTEVLRTIRFWPKCSTITQPIEMSPVPSAVPPVIGEAGEGSGSNPASVVVGEIASPVPAHPSARRGKYGCDPEIQPPGVLGLRSVVVVHQAEYGGGSRIAELSSFGSGERPTEAHGYTKCGPAELQPRKIEVTPPKEELLKASCTEEPSVDEMVSNDGREGEPADKSPLTGIYGTSPVLRAQSSERAE